MGFQAEKQVVLDHYAALDAGADMPACGPDLLWRGFHPFGEIIGAAAVSEQVWRPMRAAITSLQRRMDIFFAGENYLPAGGRWVVSMGHLMGLFDRPWLGLKPTGKIVMLRYAAFHRVDGGRVVEEAMYFDIPHLMVQAGYRPFPGQTAQHLVQPGPTTHAGLLHEDRDPKEGRRTLAAIEAMINDLGTWQLGLPLEEELRRTWHEDMLWWGPEGIGATYTIPRYAQQHSAPFRAAFSERSSTGHIARLAEGHFGGFFGWPNFTARLTGPFMGQEPDGKLAEFRVIDLYRRQGDKLAENWVVIDLLHFWKQHGWDILGEATGT
ncbi:hypothetical protein AIOL_002862 [Candidatus Rhodobacter oscarellae]|uniref:SnoaL-like domain-containing protein n=1 Tax=Candidatus Rhodobacter oscarellae TaxID=1675527 RepID=A0A0J9E801_9RHOB|nr:ester cyclase [Candidatus Rhodobacter lobularis]KMW57894.1 hypothetical protein AIOL_002862 [Candidatus Rhodobacter lobularis]